MSMEIARLLADLVRDIAWPVVVFLVAWAFRRELMAVMPSFSRREIEFEAFGLKAKMGATEQQRVSSEKPAIEKLPLPTTEPSPNPVINLVESRLREELEKTDPAKKEATLLRALAASRLEAGHEWVYIRIFGSQIAGLKRLNEVGRVSIDDAKSFLEPYEAQFPEVYSRYGFDLWLGFLTSNLLVKQDGVFLEITDIGRDFLRFIIDQRLSELKPC